MKIGLLIAFAGRPCGGPEVFEREMVRAMLDIAPQHEYHLYCLDRRAPSVIEVQAENVIYHLLEPSLRAISMATSLPLAIARTRPDVFHALVIPAPFVPMDMVYTLACSSLFQHPEFFPFTKRMRLRFLLHRAIPRAVKVICVSEHVRDATLERYSLPADRVPVIYPGVSRLFRPIAETEKRTFVEERYGIRYPYFLFSGRWEHRKNVVGTLKAFAMFKKESRTEHKLVFTGQRTWAAGEAEAVIDRLGLKDMIVDLGKTPIPELPYLYGAADGVVYASLWEGFGLPIVEGMSCGTPVITSNVAAMPETAGGAALLVDPHNVEDIAAAMHRLATDAQLRASLSARGLERAKIFSWENTVRKTLDVYGEVLGYRSVGNYLGANAVD